MRIKMLKTECVLTDGITLQKWRRGEEYSARDSVACLLISQGKAVVVRSVKL